MKRALLLVVLLGCAVALADTMLRNKGTTVGPVKTIDCTGEGHTCSRASASSVGTVHVHTASDTDAGVVNVGEQGFRGMKTFLVADAGAAIIVNQGDLADLGGGQNDHFYSDGTNIQVGVLGGGGVVIGSAFKADSFWSRLNPTTAATRLIGTLPAASATSLNPAWQISANADLDDTDAIVSFQENNSTDRATVNAVGTFSSFAASGVNAFSATVTGARYDLGAGTADYLVSDGTTGVVPLGTGTGTARLTGTIDSTAASVGNVGTGEDTLYTYSVPASSLVTTSRGLRFFATGNIFNNANTKTLKFHWGATSVSTAAAFANTNSQWRCTAYVYRTGSNTQRVVATWEVSNSALQTWGFVTQTTTSAAETEAGAVVVKVTGEATSNNDVEVYTAVLESI